LALVELLVQQHHQITRAMVQILYFRLSHRPVAVAVVAVI
jgi:hypothetical protein